MRTPKISLVAYSEKDFVFVGIPNEPGRYVRTHPCVVTMSCPVCGALMGEPCFNQYWHRDKKVKRYWASTHADRRSKHAKFKNPNVTIKPKRDILSIERDFGK